MHELLSDREFVLEGEQVDDYDVDFEEVSVSDDQEELSLASEQSADGSDYFDNL
jgi:hypothetical protein